MKFIYKAYKDFAKLPLLHKLFIILLIIIAVHLVNYKHITYENYDDMTSGKRFESKIDSEVFDLFYSKYYDNIHENKERDVAQLKIILNYAKNKKFVKFLDVGCGTGYHVSLLDKMKYDVVGIDKSKTMIAAAKSKYPDCNFNVGDILNNNLYDYSSFTHIICLNKTIYYIKDKDTFFDNCSLLLTSDGLLIIHLIDRDKFKPFIIYKNDKTVLYNPEKHNNVITRNLIKINSNLEYVCEYEKNEDYEANDANDANDANNANNANKTAELTKLDYLNNPYSYYKETFQNVETNSVRKNIINLYMPTIEEIVAIAKVKGFIVKDKQSLDSIDHINEFLFILKKVS
uniref:Methyltransferase domain-containing protein n=1 Tax=viral metagenome TaxID=1070528 RepID=A0A6C0KTE0_9ZZZZ